MVLNVYLSFPFCIFVYFSAFIIIVRILNPTVEDMLYLLGNFLGCFASEVWVSTILPSHTHHCIS